MCVWGVDTLWPVALRAIEYGWIRSYMKGGDRVTVASRSWKWCDSIVLGLFSGGRYVNRYP